MKVVHHLEVKFWMKVACRLNFERRMRVRRRWSPIAGLEALHLAKIFCLVIG
jgi:hypothetical protein